MRADSGSGDNVVTEDLRHRIEDFFRRIGTTSPEAFRTHKLPLLALPEDIEALTASDPAAAAALRLDLRNAIRAALAAGRRITDFDRRSRQYILTT